MSLKGPTDENKEPIDATNAQLANKTGKSATIVLNDGAWRHIAPSVDSETIPYVENENISTPLTAYLPSLLLGTLPLSPAPFTLPPGSPVLMLADASGFTKVSATEKKRDRRGAHTT